MRQDKSSATALVEALERYFHSMLTGRLTPVAIPATPASADEIRLRLFENLVSVASEAYKENARINSVLDDKAQKLAQTAGIFLAAGFALMRPGSDNVAKYVGIPGLAAMTGAVSFLMIAVITTLVANWIRRNPTPPNPERVQEMTMLLVELPDNELTIQRRVRLMNDFFGLWIDILAKQQRSNRIKASVVRIGQLFGLAIVVVGFLLILVLRTAMIQKWRGETWPMRFVSPSGPMVRDVPGRLRPSATTATSTSREKYLLSPNSYSTTPQVT